MNRITSRIVRNNTKRIRVIKRRNFRKAPTTLNQTATAKKEAMFCFQCEQTQDTKGCTTIGVCGKTPEVSRLQDLLMYANKGISMYARRAGDLGVRDEVIDRWILESMFSTLTNVNFDESRFVRFLEDSEQLLAKAKNMYEKACKTAGKTPEVLSGPANFRRASEKDVNVLMQQAELYSIPSKQARLGADYVGLQELITYGLKGACAYADHARLIGKESADIYYKIHKVMDFLTKENASVDELLGCALGVGELNLQIMALLDDAATTKWGHPVPTQVRTSGIKGKCILVSGHDIRDLELILQQSEGKGINVYTHGELLPAHAYPALKKYKHLAGNYGGAWQLQKMEFSQFPGPIVMTTNCIIEPKKRYFDRIYTRSVVGWPGVKHVGTNDDFSEVVAKALESEGFKEDEKASYTTVGFARNTVLGVADKVVDAVKAGHIKHFFLIGGCDGSEGERNYFKEVALGVPKDCVILTLACGKYRFNKFDFGKIEALGIPRLLDVGQCNDSYSAIQIAVGLANAFKTDVNSLPLSFVVSWFEQKAVAVLLTLLFLGIKNIYLGPNLPAFCTPAMLEILVKNYQIKKIGNVQSDLKQMLGK